MTREEAKKYWTAKYEAAREWDDPHWEASERKEHRRYVDALKAAIEALQAQTDGDLISRQDAIDAVCRSCLRTDLEVLDGCLGEYCSSKAELKSVPSAEPKKCIASIVIDAEEVAKRIKEKNQLVEWIPVSERLPIMRTEVIYSFDGIVSTGYMTDRDFNGEKMELHWEDLEIGATIEPIAWMPLPEPYREDGEA